MYSRWLRNSFIYLLILVAVIALVFSFFSPGKSTQSKPISDVARMVTEGKFKTRKEAGSSLPEQLKAYGVDSEPLKQVQVNNKEPSQFGNWIGLLINFLP